MDGALGGESVERGAGTSSRNGAPVITVPTSRSSSRRMTPQPSCSIRELPGKHEGGGRGPRLRVRCVELDVLRPVFFVVFLVVLRVVFLPVFFSETRAAARSAEPCRPWSQPPWG